MKTSRVLALCLIAACVGGGLWFQQYNPPPASSTGKFPGASAGFENGIAQALQSPLSRERSAQASPASNSAVRQICGFVERPSYAEHVEKALPAGARFVRYARMDHAYLEGKQSPLWLPAGEGVFSLPLQDGRTLSVRVKRSEMLDAVRYVSEGVIEGQPGSRVILAGGAEGQYSLEIMETTPVTREGVLERGPRHIVMAPTGEAEMIVFEVDETKAPPCGGQIVLNAEERAAALQQRVAALTSSGAGAALPSAASQATAGTSAPASPFTVAASINPTLVDVLFLYTQAILDAQLSGSAASKVAAVQARVDTIIASTNSDMLRSQVNVVIRQAGLEFVAYDETLAEAATVNSTALGQLRKDTDGVLDSVVAMRDTKGADLVCLMLNRYDSSSIGIAYMLPSPTVKDTRGSLFNDLYAFSVVTYAYTTGYNLVSHELGHNFGAQHDRENAYGEDSAGAKIAVEGGFPYSYGYRFYGGDGLQYRTIMSYAPGARLSYFSNPEIIATEPGIQRAVGVAEGLPGQAYNAKTLNETAFEVSQWRHQISAAIANGTLVNVSTRAFVGTGDEQLTAGFSIEGTGEKELLIRASGPSLIPFGMANTVSDPWIELTAVPSMVVKAKADDRVKETNLAAIDEAVFQLSAFKQTSDKDSALLIKLAPGMYTAKVEGVAGATGFGIVEVYETANSGTAKLVNLSTRAYASKKKEIVGGFVISGAPGTTKRILLRAQGPNLTGYGVAGAMYDPYMELYRAGQNTKYLIACDDWTASYQQVDDEHPTATYYDEKAIAATGFAPKNRREPAIMVDLEPGLYTVMITPFQHLSTVESENQVEKPGVAIVEVFEIKP